jgi:hypothetical protein
VATGRNTHARLRTEGLTRLRAHGRLSVRVAATITDALGRRERRSAHIVLRRG